MIRCEVTDVQEKEFGVKIELSGNGQDIAREFYAIYQEIKRRIPAAAIIVETQIKRDGEEDV